MTFTFSVRAYFFPGFTLCTVDLRDEPGIIGKRPEQMQEPFEIPRPAVAELPCPQLQVATAALCWHALAILTPLGKRSCNSGAGFSFELRLVLPTSHFWHGLLRGVVQVQGKSGDGWQRAGCLTCQRMRDARYAHRAERFKNGTLRLSHIVQNGQFVF